MRSPSLILLFACALTLAACGDDEALPTECGAPVHECTTDQDCVDQYESDLYTCRTSTSECGTMSVCGAPSD